MDPITATIIEHIENTNLTFSSVNDQLLLEQAQVAFIDYVASLLPARTVEPVKELAAYVTANSLFTGPATPYEKENTNFSGNGPLYFTASLRDHLMVRKGEAALFYGFTSHYLDYDDAQANLAGHFSTVLFSALLAVVETTDSWKAFLTAYIVGAEIEGLIGSFINPMHRTAGWHSTGTVGHIGAAVAIGKLRGLTGESLASYISLCATQSSGMAFQAGYDGKPLHSGLAAQHAVNTFELVQRTSLQGSTNPFNNKSGWLKTMANVEITESQITNQWLAPGQILSPGLWMKVHPYCSAAICGAGAAAAIYEQLHNAYGLRDPLWDTIESVIIHFPPNADAALRYKSPKTGREGQFSMEYVVWQILTYGCIRNELFYVPHVDEAFTRALTKIERQYDLPPVDQDVRVAKLTVTLTSGERIIKFGNNPKGSPSHPFTGHDLAVKLEQGTSADKVRSFLALMEGNKADKGILPTMAQVLEKLRDI